MSRCEITLTLLIIVALLLSGLHVCGGRGSTANQLASQLASSTTPQPPQQQQQQQWNRFKVSRRLRDQIDIAWDDFNRIRHYIANNFLALRTALKNNTSSKDNSEFRNRLEAELVADREYLKASAARLVHEIEASEKRNFPIKVHIDSN
jgi:hypothetical protein